MMTRLLPDAATSRRTIACAAPGWVMSTAGDADGLGDPDVSVGLGSTAG